MSSLFSPFIRPSLLRSFSSASSASSSSASSSFLLNQVNLPAVISLITAIKSNPKAAETKWRSRVEWKGAFQSEASIPNTNHKKILSDEPTVLGGGGSAPNPVEILLSSLGQCLSVGYAAAASANNIEIKSLKIDLEGDINIIPFLGLGKVNNDDNAGYRSIKVDVHLDTNADKNTLEKIHQHVVATSPVGHTLQKPIPINFQLHTK